MRCTTTRMPLVWIWLSKCSTLEMKPDKLYWEVLDEFVGGTVNASLGSEVLETEDHRGGFWMSVVDNKHKGCQGDRWEYRQLDGGKWLAEKNVLEDWPLSPSAGQWTQLSNPGVQKLHHAGRTDGILYFQEVEMLKQPAAPDLSWQCLVCGHGRI